MKIYILYPAEFYVKVDSALGKKYLDRINSAIKILSALGHEPVTRELVSDAAQMHSMSARMDYFGQCIKEMSKCDAVFVLSECQETMPRWWATMCDIPNNFNLKIFKTKKDVLEFLNI